MTRLNPNRSEFTYRYVRLEKAEDALRLGYYPHPECLKDTHHGKYSLLVEWMCSCPDPLEKPPMSKSNRSDTCHRMEGTGSCPLWSAAYITYSRAS